MKYSSLTTEELIELCAKSGDPDAWQEFIRRFHKLIASAIVRVAYGWGERRNAVIEELVQDTFVKICADNRRMLRQFKPRNPNSFYQMLKVTAGNLARDHFRKEKGDKRDPGLPLADIEDVGSFVPDGHSPGAEQIEREILMQEIDRVLQEHCSSRDQEIFWLHHRHGFTAQEIAAISAYELSTKGVESVLHRLRDLLCEAFEPPPQQPEGISNQNSFTKGEGHR